MEAKKENITCLEPSGSTKKSRGVLHRGQDGVLLAFPQVFIQTSLQHINHLQRPKSSQPKPNEYQRLEQIAFSKIHIFQNTPCCFLPRNKKGQGSHRPESVRTACHHGPRIYFFPEANGATLFSMHIIRNSAETGSRLHRQAQFVARPNWTGISGIRHLPGVCKYTTIMPNLQTLMLNVVFR